MTWFCPDGAEFRKKKKNSCHCKIITSPTAVAAARGRVGTGSFPPRAHDIKKSVCCIGVHTATLSGPRRHCRLLRTATRPNHCVMPNTCSCFLIICRALTGPGKRADRGLCFCRAALPFSKTNATFVGSVGHIWHAERRIWPHY